MRLLLHHFSAVFDDRRISGLGRKVIHYDLNVFIFFYYRILKIYWDRILSILDINIFRQEKKCTVARECIVTFKTWKLEPNFLSHMGNPW